LKSDQNGIESTCVNMGSKSLLESRMVFLQWSEKFYRCALWRAEDMYSRKYYRHYDSETGELFPLRCGLVGDEARVGEIACAHDICVFLV